MNDPSSPNSMEIFWKLHSIRPDVYNALNLDMMKMLGETLSSAAADHSIKAILLTGKGKAFCSGGDLKWISQQTEEAGSVLYRLAPAISFVDH